MEMDHSGAGDTVEQAILLGGGTGRGLCSLPSPSPGENIHILMYLGDEGRAGIIHFRSRSPRSPVLPPESHPNLANRCHPGKRDL